MRSVGKKDTDVEMLLRRALWSYGLRYRLNRKIEGTRPDLVFTGAKVALFVDGCFWHGCPRCYRPPKSNVNYWTRKIDRNMRRDIRDRLRLETRGWRVLRFWGCEIKSELARVVEEICQNVGVQMQR